VRILCSRFLLVVAFGLLPICLGGLSGCGSKLGEGELAEETNISAEQRSEVKNQYQKQMLARKVKSSKKGKTARR
jgi:hypothetical protein